MFYKYNAALRKFPQDAYESCRVRECTCKRDSEKRVVLCSCCPCNNGGRNKDGPCSCFNTYPTTINAILSGLRKLMWVAPLPKGRFVYRGLSGMNLPDEFFKQDEYGVRGGTEFGMMSTTVHFHCLGRFDICRFLYSQLM
jgi:hypothetical protein